MINNKNIIKEKFANNERCLVSWAHAASNITAEILASAGFDGLLIDMEHGSGDFPILCTQIQAMNGYPAVPIVRIAINDPVLIKRTLDIGAYAIWVPYVETAEEAKKAVLAAKYPPAGTRGLAGSPRAANYGMNPAAYFKRANDDILVFIAIESLKGVDNLDAILEVEGVDGFFVGPGDLSSNMGYLGDTTVPEVQDKINFIEDKILKAGKNLLALGMSSEEAKKKFDKGAKLVVNMSDVIGISKMACDKVAEFRNNYK